MPPYRTIPSNEEPNLFYRQFLQTLFFQAFAKPESQRDETVTALVGKVKYLNGGLFLQHPLENRLFWFLCGNEVYTDSFFRKIVLKVLPNKHFTIP